MQSIKIVKKKVSVSLTQLSLPLPPVIVHPKPLRIENISAHSVKPLMLDAMVSDSDFVRVLLLVLWTDHEFWHCHHLSFHSRREVMEHSIFLYLTLMNRDHFARFHIHSNWKRVVDDDHSGLRFELSVVNGSADFGD